MTKLMNEWFFMRPGFARFRMEPEKDPQYLFGAKDRRQRDLLLTAMQEECYSQDGHKAAVFGDYGRGKTHQCFNIQFEIRRRNLPLLPMYIKCAAYGTKEPFQTLFREMVLAFPTAQIQEVATTFHRRPEAKQEILNLVQSEDIAHVVSKGLTAVELDEVRNSMRWLGGEAKVEMGLIRKSLQPRLHESREFGSVMRAIAHMYATVQGKVPFYLVDEAERFQNITHPDSYYLWLASIRELAEIMGLGLVFLIGAKTRNELPTIFVQDEIIRRIGVTNYIEFTNPGKDDLEEFLLELMQTVIRKGEVPAAHRDVVQPAALDTAVPAELATITRNDPERLRAFPFDPDAFEEFVTQVTSGDLASKPSEALIRLQKAAQRAMRLDLRTIPLKVVSEINSEGF